MPQDDAQAGARYMIFAQARLCDSAISATLLSCDVSMLCYALFHTYTLFSVFDDMPLLLFLHAAAIAAFAITLLLLH